MGISVRAEKKVLQALLISLRPQLAQAVRETAIAVNQEAQEAAPVKTGFLRASIHTVTARGRNARYRSAVTRAGKRANRKLFPPIANVSSDLEGAVAVGAVYGEPVEKRRGYLGPAARAQQSAFQRRVKAVLQKAAKR